MVVRKVPVDLGEEGAGVVGTVDGAVVAGQGAVEGRVHEVAQPGVDALAVVLPGVPQRSAGRRRWKKKTRSFLSGPPRVKPNCPWPKSGFRSRPSWRAVPDRAELLPKRCREPCRSLPPDLVMTLTKPPLERPNSALAPCGTTTISSTASRLKVKAGRWPPRCSPKKGLLKSAPSTEMLLWMPRCPAMLNSSPSGPWTMAAPGVSSVRSRKLRPLLGRSPTASSGRRVAGPLRVMSTAGAAASTTTSSICGRSVIVSSTVSPTRTCTPVRRTPLHPGARTVTS